MQIEQQKAIRHLDAVLAEIASATGSNIDLVTEMRRRGFNIAVQYGGIGGGVPYVTIFAIPENMMAALGSAE